MWRSKAGSLRDSKHPERSPALRSISNNAKERLIVGLGEHIYESTKLAALFDVLVDRGCPAGEILRNVNLTVDEVHSPKSRISLAELMTACENAIRLSSDPHLPYRMVHRSTSPLTACTGSPFFAAPTFAKRWLLHARITKALHGKTLKGWTPHDFRRSISTALHERFGVAPHVVEVLLGHIDGHKSGVAGVYNKALYLDERRDALERWGAHIMELVTGKPERPPRGPAQSRAKLQRRSRPVGGVTALRRSPTPPSTPPGRRASSPSEVVR